jgi:hypothetical protein
MLWGAVYVFSVTVLMLRGAVYVFPTTVLMLRDAVYVFPALKRLCIDIDAAPIAAHFSFGDAGCADFYGSGSG